MGFALVYENFADQGVLSGGAWLMPAANLQDADLGAVARAGAAGALVNVDLGGLKPVGGIVLGPTNLSPGATYRTRAYQDAAQTILAYDSGVLTVQGNAVDWSRPAAWLEWEDPNFWLGIVPTDAPELPFYVAHLIPAASSGAALAQFWRIEAADPGNPDGVIDFGRLLMGRIFRPSQNYAYDGNDFGIEPLVDITESLGGSEAFWDRGMRRTFRASWPTLPEAEAFDAWIRIALRARTSRQVFVVPEESDAEDLMRKRAFLARFRATPRLAQTFFQHAASSIDLQEVL